MDYRAGHVAIWSLRSQTFHQLEAIAKRVEDVEAAKVVEGGVWPGDDAGAVAGGEDFIQFGDNERGMSALCRSEIGLDAKVKIYGAGDEPDALAFGHLWRLFYFGKAENAGIEVAGTAFAAGWNGDLHVIKVEDGHRSVSASACVTADTAWRQWIPQISSGQPLRRAGRRVRRRDRFRGGVRREEWA